MKYDEMNILFENNMISDSFYKCKACNIFITNIYGKEKRRFLCLKHLKTKEHENNLEEINKNKESLKNHIEYNHMLSECIQLKL